MWTYVLLSKKLDKICNFQNKYLNLYVFNMIDYENSQFYRASLKSKRIS